MNIDDRLTYLNATIAAMGHTWPQVVSELQSMVDGLTAKLISADDEQTRGAIKALRRVMALPEMLKIERDHIKLTKDDAT